jgi:hypothetical protein
MAMSGMLRRNAIRHETESTNTPPSTGPKIVVAADAAAQIPKARPCSSPSKLTVISDSEPGTRIAPVAPWRILNRTRISMFHAKPQRTEVTANPVSPTANIRFRPSRSFRAPARIRKALRVTR